MHRPVMLQEVVERLRPAAGQCFIDGTAGAGGHAAALLERVGPSGCVLAVDRDAAAVARLRTRLEGWGAAARVVHGDFAALAELAARAGVQAVDGVLLDLGISSDQLDDPARGLSFLRDGPLDMRMDRTQGPTAADVVNGWSEAELTAALRAYGEEPRAGRIARAIVRARALAPISGTLALERVVSPAAGGRRGRQHPATRTFQALRIAVNRELEQLDAGLEAGLRLLKPGGRMAVISFHSLEDRQVKQCFAQHAGHWESLPQGGRAWRGATPAVVRVTRKPLAPTAAEVAANPRARSAKLRVVERVAEEPGAAAA